MKIVVSRFLRGPNIHAMTPRRLAVVDLETLSDNAVGTGFVECLGASLADVGRDVPLAGGVLADLVAPLVAALQALAGSPVDGASGWPVAGASGQHWVLCGYEHESVADAALLMAVDALGRLAAGRPVDLRPAVAALQALVAERLVDAGVQALLQPNVPIRRDAGALGDFFASKSRGTTPLIGGHSDRWRPQSSPARA